MARSQAERAASEHMPLRTWQRLQRAAARAGWDEESSALFRDAVTEQRISVAALEQIALAPHWIQRAVMHVFFRDPPHRAPIRRGAVADIIAACREALELGDEDMLRKAAAPCCDKPWCGQLSIGDSGRLAGALTPDGKRIRDALTEISAGELAEALRGAS